MIDMFFDRLLTRVTLNSLDVFVTIFYNISYIKRCIFWDSKHSSYRIINESGLIKISSTVYEISSITNRHTNCPHNILIILPRNDHIQNSKIFNLIMDDGDCFSYAFFYIYNSYLMIDINGIALGRTRTNQPVQIDLSIRSLFPFVTYS